MNENSQIVVAGNHPPLSSDPRMVKFGDKFCFHRADKYNLDLYHLENKEIIEGGGRGKGRGKGTGNFEERWVLVGHYSSFTGVIYKIAELDSENKNVAEILKGFDTLKSFANQIQADFPIMSRGEVQDAEVEE